jgi:glutaredoxin
VKTPFCPLCKEIKGWLFVEQGIQQNVKYDERNEEGG